MITPSSSSMSLLDIARRVKGNTLRNKLDAVKANLHAVRRLALPAAATVTASSAFAVAMIYGGDPGGAPAALPAVTAALAAAHGSRQALKRGKARSRLAKMAAEAPTLSASASGALIGGAIGGLTGNPEIIALNAAVGALISASLAPEAPSRSTPSRGKIGL